jgi:hypothetical protein
MSTMAILISRRNSSIVYSLSPEGAGKPKPKGARASLTFQGVTLIEFPLN